MSLERMGFEQVARSIEVVESPPAWMCSQNQVLEEKVVSLPSSEVIALAHRQSRAGIDDTF